MSERGYTSLKRNAPSPSFVFPLYRQIYEAKTSIKEIEAPTVQKQGRGIYLIYNPLTGAVRGLISGNSNKT